MTNDKIDVDGPEAIDLVRELDIALHGNSWARPYSPRAVWQELLHEVRILAELQQCLEELHARGLIRANIRR